MTTPITCNKCNMFMGVYDGSPQELNDGDLCRFVCSNHVVISLKDKEELQ